MLRCVKYQFSEAPQEYWDFVHKYGTIFQSKSYLNFQAAITTREPLVLAIFDDDRIVGGAGVTVGRKVLCFRSGASVFFAPVVADKEKAPIVFNCLTKFMKSMSLYCHVSVLPEHTDILNKDNCFKAWDKKEAEYLYWDISGSLESLWDALSRERKRGVKRGRKEEVIVQEIENDHHVRQFYDLHVMTMGRGGHTPHRLAYYETLFDMLKPEGLVKGFLALHPETRQPIAGVTLLLGMRGEAEHLAIGHNYEFREFRGSDLLMWHCLEFLKSEGYVLFNLFGLPKGDSARAKGIRHFKTTWAGKNGNRLPTYELSRGIFGLNPDFVRRNMGFARRCIHILRKFKGEKRENPPRTSYQS